MKLREIGLTDYYFKELIKRRPDYLLLLINNICNLNLTLEDIKLGENEEMDILTFKTVSYDIRIISDDLNIDIEAQKKIINENKNENGEYEYDINRAIYYLCMLHSSSYKYRESGYKNKKTIVIFIYNYEIPGKDYIQKINLYNNSTNVHYNDLNIYFISLEKIPKNSKIEVERALKMLSEKDITKYETDKSEVIKEAAQMLKEFDESEKAVLRGINRERERFERESQLGMAEDKGRKEGIKEGLKEGIKEGRTKGIAEGKTEAIINNIKTMHKNGFDIETISKALDLDIEYVKEVLNN